MENVPTAEAVFTNIDIVAYGRYDLWYLRDQGDGVETEAKPRTEKSPLRHASASLLKFSLSRQHYRDVFRRLKTSRFFFFFYF